MRLGLSTTLFVLFLAVASNASAQEGVDGCVESAVAMAVDGTPLEVRMPRADGMPERAPLELAWCRDAGDPRCQPLSPAPDAPGSGSSAEAPRYLAPDFGFGGEPMVVFMRAAGASVPRADAPGPSGFRFGLDRPPRIR